MNNDQEHWRNDSCQTVRSQYSVFSIYEAAALWCGVPDNQIDQIKKEVKPLNKTGVGRCIWTHPAVPCLEAKSRAIAFAIEENQLPYGREDGKEVVVEHVAYERRHFFGRDLRKWMEAELPNEKPAFLFDEIERSTHSAIDVDSFRALQAQLAAAEARISKGHEWAKQKEAKVLELTKERDDLRSRLEKLDIPGERAEVTYQNIIFVLLESILGGFPGAEKHPSFPSKAKLIEKIAEMYAGYAGLSKRTLEQKFVEARRRFNTQ